MKKSTLFVVFVIIFLAITSFFVALVYMCKNISPKASDLDSKLTTKQAEERGEIVKEHNIQASLPETSFNGVIGSVTSPKGINVKILEIEGNIDDMEALENMKNSDFSGDSVEIPMIKKTFKVAIDENTKLVGFDSLSDIKSGDQVRVDAGHNPREVKEFTAVTLELNFRTK
jgi:hypothetical protein